MKFEYADKEQSSFFKLGASNNVGFYPIGAQFNWHGGLHIQEHRTDPVKAIADGTIIAYRMLKKPIETNGIKFSSAFVLIQHQYTSPKDRKLTFYSLYNHLMPYSELKQYRKIPDIFKTQQYVVKSKKPFKAKGIIAYKSISKHFTMVLPVNSIIQPCTTPGFWERNTTHWAKYTEFTKIKFIHPESGLVYDDLYVDLNNKQVEKINDTIYRVTGDETYGKCWDYENLRKTPDYSIDTNIVMQVPNDSKFTIIEKSGKYYHIKKLNGKEQKGYIYAASGKEDRFILDINENNLDKIVTGNDCNIPVKAGDIIGFTGPMGHSEHNEYRTTHLEVFTATDPTSFLTGKDGKDKDDTKDTQHFIKIETGAILSLKYPVTFTKDDEILVLTADPAEDYYQIKLHKQYRTVEKAILGKGKAPTSADSNYTYKNYDITEINKSFNNTITKGSVIYLNEDASKFKDGQTSRDVYFTLPGDEPGFWVHKNQLPTGVTLGQYIKLNKNLETLYYQKPNKNDITDQFPNDTDIETEIVSDLIVSKKEIEEIKQGEETWYKIKIHDYRGKREGLIKSTNPKTKRISAHDWTAFGFKVLKDQPNEFIFDAEEEESPQFLKAVFKEMDTDGNKNLSSIELQKGLHNMHVSERLSKLVCYHQSEWGVNYSSLKAEIETLLNIGIEKEKDSDMKKLLEDQKEKALKITEDKVNALDFWSGVKVPDGANASFEPFPTDTKVYHFHPNAFIEQMRRLRPCSCPIDEPLFKCVKYSSNYGPAYFGNKSLNTYTKWDNLIKDKKITFEQKQIVIAMSENEGNMDAIQSYDSEILTFGAMQKTVSPSGYGEFPIQVYEFKEVYPSEYKKLFSNCGWVVEKGDDKRIKMYFLLNGEKISGKELKNIIREGFSSDSYKKKVSCSPLAHLVKVGNSEYFQEKQILDFIDRLVNKVLILKPNNYAYSLNQYLKSKLGKACVLDHHVNRPAHVKLYFGEALTRFFNKKDSEIAEFNKGKNKSEQMNNVSRNPSNWGNNHATYELEILEIYGPLRGETLGNVEADDVMTSATNRYNKLKKKLL